MGSYIALCFGSSPKLVPCPEGCLGLPPLVPPAFEYVSFHTDVLTLPKVELGKEAGKGKEPGSEIPRCPGGSLCFVGTGFRKTSSSLPTP